MAKKTPKDEMLLAEMIGAAKSNGLKGCTGASFLYDDERKQIACCAAGALSLVTGCDPSRPPASLGLNYYEIYTGNDRDRDEDQDGLRWSDLSKDRGESLGWAFRNAME